MPTSIIKFWISLAIKKRDVQKVKDLWLLLDFAYGDYSENFKKKNIDRLKFLLSKMDNTVDGVRQVKKCLENIK